jgi:hypothetical protein
MTDLTNDLDIQIELNDLRTLVLSGQRLPAARYRQLIDNIRDTRENAAKLAASSRAKAKKSLGAAKKEVDLESLFS